MQNRRKLLLFIAALLLCLCAVAFGALAEDVEVSEGVFHGYSGNALDRGVYHTKYPELSDFKIVEGGTTVNVGDTIHLRVKATAYDTTVSSIYMYVGRNRNHENNVSMILNEETGYYEGTYTFTKTDRPGEYYITSASVYDQYDFHTSYYSDSKRVMKRLFPSSVILKNDEYAQIFKNVTFQESGKVLSPGDTLHFSFDVLKNAEIRQVEIDLYSMSGGRSLYLYYYPETYSWSSRTGEWNYNAETGIVTCSYTLKETDFNGRYYLGHIYVRDEENTSYQARFNSRDSYVFTLENATTAGSESADQYLRVEDITCEEDGKTLVDGDKIHVRFKLDTNGEIENAQVNLEYFDAEDYTYGSGVNTYISKTIFVDASPVEGSAGLYQAEYTLLEDDLYGAYSVNVWASARFTGSEETGDNYQNVTETSELMFLFDEKKTTELRRLAPVTDLNWTEDGLIRFTLPADFQGHFSVKLHTENQDLDSQIMWNSYTSETAEDIAYFRDIGVDILNDVDDLTSGKYYCSVIVEGDGVNYFDSVSAKSELFTYTAPTKKLGMVADIAWKPEENELTCVVPAQETEDYWPECEWYFAELETDIPEYCYWRSSGWDKYEDGRFYFTLPDRMLQEYGSGYYYGIIRLVSDDIMRYRHGDWTELTVGQYIGADEQGDSTISKLEEVEVSDKTADEIRAQVQQISTEDLKTALLTDERAADVMRELEISAGAETEVVKTAAAPEMEGSVTTVGAGLNNVTGNAPKLIIDKPKQEDVMPSQYDNAVALKFSMELENVEQPDNLKVPVLVDMPIPKNMAPGYVVILHYHLTTNAPEVIYPYIYQAGNQWYAQFALTRFSDFIMTQDLEDVTMVLPASLEKIEAESFQGIKAVVVVVPDGCKEIGSRAFGNCPNLYTVSAPAGTVIAEDAFEGCVNEVVVNRR